MKEGYDDGFGARLRELKGSESVNAFAKFCEVPEASMRGYLDGKIPTADRALRIARKTKADFEWLISGDESHLPGTSGAQLVVARPTEGEVAYFQTPFAVSPEFAMIPRLDVQASAGGGRLAISEDPLEYLAFQAVWLRSRGINPATARILTARGDSMEETIRDGDVLLIDTSINRIKDNAIYIVVYGDMVLVKRVHGRLNGSLQLISDNPRYPPEEVTSAEVDQLNIAGRVMWFGRTI
ncbi:S24 family peptidase [Shinella zoogloeoides]|nr:helix-turn-helix transcriptional regulator [Shinella zoogloeoides]UEX82819.1 helix-turn-helix transcriptional regulator [Shinella zoogloeoides]